MKVQGEVPKGVKRALDAKGIDIPYATQVMLFHDQTEDADGHRDAQREGWPPRSKRPEPADNGRGAN